MVNFKSMCAIFSLLWLLLTVFAGVRCIISLVYPAGANPELDYGSPVLISFGFACLFLLVHLLIKH
jgi:hypothetical protein